MNPRLRPYVPVAEMLAQTFGRDCEVVVHDLRDPEHSVVYVANGTVTGRRVGESFDHLIRQVIFSSRREENFVSNYFFRTPNGKLIRSSTLLIREPDGTLSGALCVNLDTSRIALQMEFLREFLPAGEEAPPDPLGSERHVSGMIEGLIDNILASCGHGSLSREEKLEKIRFMDEKGIFLMKGSVELVAAKLGVSGVTVYSYLNAVRERRGGEEAHL